MCASVALVAWKRSFKSSNKLSIRKLFFFVFAKFFVSPFITIIIMDAKSFPNLSHMLTGMTRS